MKREIIIVPIGEVHPYEGSHEITPSIEPLKKSISEFGIQQPILVDKTRTIVAGNAIYLACSELGYNEIPIVELSDLTEEQIKQYRIADNKTSEFARWNEDKLKKELSYLDNPTSLQFCFDEDLTRFFKPISTKQSDSVPNNESEDRAQATGSENLNTTANTPSGPGQSEPSSTEKEKKDEQKFQEELNKISKGREVEQQQYIEHVCSKCGKKIIMKA